MKKFDIKVVKELKLHSFWNRLCIFDIDFEWFLQIEKNVLLIKLWPSISDKIVIFEKTWWMVY